MAERIIANLTLDTYQRNKIPPLVIPQHDYGARYIRVRITEQGENVSVASGSVVSIIAKRMADGQSAAFSGSVNADGSVLVPVTQWMLDAPSDDVDCHVAVTGTGYQYSTTSFVISPQERENPSYLEEDDPRVNIVEEALIKVVEEADRAEEQADLAQSAASTAASDAKEAARQEVEQLVGQLGIVQTLGNSRMAVVSQAVTTGLYNRNAKRIANLEQGFNEQFETDDSVAYVKDVPEGALPYAEVKKVGGMTYKDGDTLRSAKVTEVESVGMNLFDVSALSDTDKLKVFDGVIKVTTSNLDSSANTYKTFGELCPNLKVGDFVIVRAITTGNEKYIYLTKLGVVSFGNMVTVTEDVLTSDVYFYASGINTTAEISEIMVTKDTNAPYTPYLHHTLPIPAEVQALDGYGWGINEDCYNYIDWEKKQFVKKCAMVDLGTLTWTFESFYPRFNAPIHNLASVDTRADNILSSKFSTDLTADNGDNWKGFSSLGIVYVYTTEYADAATFKAAMSGVMLVYELATPEVTDISDLISADNFIGVEGNGTLMFKNAYEYAVPSEVEYQVEV